MFIKVKIDRVKLFVVATRNVRPLAIPESCAQNLGIRLLENHSFDVASAFSNLKKISLNIFLRLEQLKQNQRTFGSVDGDFIKSNRTKNTSKMLRYLLGLIYYSNTIFGNISGKNEVISLYCALKCNGAQDEFFLV